MRSGQLLRPTSPRWGPPWCLGTLPETGGTDDFEALMMGFSWDPPGGMGFFYGIFLWDYLDGGIFMGVLFGKRLQFALEHGLLKIVQIFTHHGDLNHSDVNVYQRVAESANSH